jgi:hypothetical protein
MMRKVFHFCLFLVLVSCIELYHADDCAAQIVINEFVADPARDWDGDGALNARDDEWIEIINLGEAAIDLGGYRIADGEAKPVWRYGFAGMLAPGAVMVACGSDSKAWEEANDFPAYGLSLNNSGDCIRLYLISDADTSIVDSYTYGEAAARKDRAIGRRSDDPGIWAVFDGYNPCVSACNPAGTGCYPTPGSKNTCTTPTRSRSWGDVKAMYR